MENINKMDKTVSNLGKNFLAIDTSKKIINVEKSKIKENSARALSNVMEIIKDSSNYNSDTDETVKGTLYEGQNHAYFKVNSVLTAFDDLEKSTEKTINAVLKVLLVSKNIDFSMFIDTLKDIELYSSNSHLLTNEDLKSNDNFLDKVTSISSFFNFVSLYKDNKVTKALRKILGKNIVTINDKEVNFIEILRDYKINKKISLELFEQLNNIYLKSSKEYYATLNED